jgi:pre-mRNA-splicing factor CDC5/CEF1
MIPGLDDQSIPEKRFTIYNQVLDENQSLTTKDVSKAHKTENKLGVTLDGYQIRSNALAKQVTSVFEELQKTKLDYKSFSRLRTNESATSPCRVAALKEGAKELERQGRMVVSQIQCFLLFLIALWCVQFYIFVYTQ